MRDNSEYLELYQRLISAACLLSPPGTHVKEHPLYKAFRRGFDQKLGSDESSPTFIEAGSM
jgi:hypothetical protein